MNPPELAPIWFADEVQSAEQRLAQSQMPSVDEEVWRYSRVSDIDLEKWSPATKFDGEVPAEVSALLSSFGHLAGTVVVRNGAVIASRLDDDLAQKGVYFGSVRAGNNEGLIGSVTGDGPDYFSLANRASLVDAVTLHIPKNVVVSAPFCLVDWIDEEGAKVFPRLVVSMGENSEAQLYEWQGSADVSAFCAPIAEVSLDQAARFSHYTVQLRGEKIWQIASQVSRVERDATYQAVSAGLGGDYARTRTDSRLVGKNATGNLSTMYFGIDRQTLDFRTFQHHDAAYTNSNLEFLGAVGGDSRSIYTGLIRVEKDAKGTNAFQTNRNLKLSETAWAESVPNLEIETNDVRCSHASTVGPIDEDQLFYLESRGVPTDIAKRLIVSGFFFAVVEQFPLEFVRDQIAAAIAQRLQKQVIV